MPEPRLTNYWDYIKVEELLRLQGGLEDDDQRLANDEVLFIAVHQVFELWFKLILRELRTARDLFCAERVHEQQLSGAARSLQRVTTILHLAVHHFEVIETLTTREYLAFRDKLMGASGFQSAQLRQIEILMGLDDSERIPLGIQGDYMDALRALDGARSSAQQRVLAQKSDMPTLRGAIQDWLYRTPIDGRPHDAPDAGQHVDAFVERFLGAHARFVDGTLSMALRATPGAADRERVERRYQAEKDSVRAFLSPSASEGGPGARRVRAAMIFIETYRELPLLAWPREILDGLVEMEQAFVVWRQRHARMVERVIGRRTGTGGSAGVDYLDQTALRYRVFRDLWAVRTLQIPRTAAPPLENAAFYGFRSGD